MKHDHEPLDLAPRETTICRSYTLEAMHWLPGLPDSHKCRRPHGHSYKIEIRITGMPDDIGLVQGVEFGAMDVIMDPIITFCDHHCWNDKLKSPTVENIATYLANVVSQRLGVPVTIRVYEGPRSWAEVSSE